MRCGSVLTPSDSNLDSKKVGGSVLLTVLAYIWLFSV